MKEISRLLSVRLDPSIRNLRFLLRMIGKNKGDESPVRRSLRRRLEEIWIVEINKLKLLDSAYGLARSERRGRFSATLKLLLLTFSFASCAQDSSDLFTQANSLYQKNDCAAALTAYDQITNKGAGTWYNMGNCAYKLNDQIKALLYWKRAYKYGNSLIQHESITNMKTLSIPYGPLPHPYSNIPPLVMQILFFCIFGVFLIVGYFLIQAKRWIFLAMSLSVLVSAGRITHQVYSASQQALIMQDTALNAGPGSEYHQIRSLSAGTTVKLLKQNTGWSQIAVGSTRGWVEDKHVEKI